MPQDFRAAFGGANHVDGILEHGYPVGHGNGECATAAALAEHYGANGNSQPGTGKQVAGDGGTLAELFRLDTRMGGRRVHKGHYRVSQTFGQPENAQRLSISPRVGHAKIAPYFLVRRYTLLLAGNKNRLSPETRHPAYHGKVVADGSVPMKFNEIVQNARGIVEHPGTLRVAGQLDALPWREISVHLAPLPLELGLKYMPLLFRCGLFEPFLKVRKLAFKRKCLVYDGHVLSLKALGASRSSLIAHPYCHAGMQQTAPIVFLSQEFSLHRCQFYHVLAAGAAPAVAFGRSAGSNATFRESHGPENGRVARRWQTA